MRHIRWTAQLLSALDAAALETLGTEKSAQSLEFFNVTIVQTVVIGLQSIEPFNFFTTFSDDLD
jgi:hypothetical protein